MDDTPSVTTEAAERVHAPPLEPAPAALPVMAAPVASAELDAAYLRHRDHVIARVESAAVGFDPFGHSFVEQIFPDDVYQAFRAHMLRCKHGGELLDRKQDNPEFRNKRFNLVDSTEPIVLHLRRLFSDPVVKLAFLKLLYLDPTPELAAALSIHGEFEYFFTQAGRFQNIHVDIPPKYLSFVFYIPEFPASPEEEERNATVLYDRRLTPHYAARFRPNSVCVFAPHFFSYHGFASTIDRDVLVMFYVDRAEAAGWRELTRSIKEAPPFTAILDAIERKLRRHPLIEYGRDEARLQRERAACRINAPQGRVMV
jgi:hypothetical protein